MVVLHVKGEAEESQFLYECSAGEPIEDVLTAVVSVHNLQSKVRHLSARLRELFFGDSPPGTAWNCSCSSLILPNECAVPYLAASSRFLKGRSAPVLVLFCVGSPSVRLEEYELNLRFSGGRVKLGNRRSW